MRCLIHARLRDGAYVFRVRDRFRKVYVTGEMSELQLRGLRTLVAAAEAIYHHGVTADGVIEKAMVRGTSCDAEEIHALDGEWEMETSFLPDPDRFCRSVGDTPVHDEDLALVRALIRHWPDILATAAQFRKAKDDFADDEATDPGVVRKRRPA